MRNFAFFLGLSVLLTVPALAEDAVPAAPSGQPAAVASGAASVQPAAAETEAMLNETVCKKQAPATGSRLGARTVCMTNKEWRERTVRTQQVITDMQQKGLGAVPGN